MWKTNLCMYLQDQLDFSGLYNITIRNVRATNDGVRFNFKILGEEIDVNLTGEKQHFDALRHPRLENKALIKEFQEMNASKDHIMKCWRHFADFIAECAFSDPLMFEPRYLQGVRSHFENDIFVKLLKLFLSTGVDPNTIENETAHFPVVDGVVMLSSLCGRKKDALELITLFGGKLLEKSILHSQTRIEILLQSYRTNYQYQPNNNSFLVPLLKSEEFKNCSEKNLISLGNFFLGEISKVLHYWCTCYDDFFPGADLAIFQPIEWLKTFFENLAENKVLEIKTKLFMEYCDLSHKGRSFIQLYEIVTNFLGIKLKKRGVYCNGGGHGNNIQTPRAVQCLKNHCIAPLKQFFIQQNRNMLNYESIKNFKYFPDALKQEILFPKMQFFGSKVGEQKFNTVKEMLRMWYENDHM